MILLLASLAFTTPDSSVAEAARALSAGRAEQAREMIRRAVGEGADGPAVDRLLADLAYTEGRWDEAGARYQTLLATGETAELLERAGLTALRQGRAEHAAALLKRAAALPDGGWRSWNGLAVIADRQQDWAAADEAHEAGLKLAPGNATLLNNRGWSLMMRGLWRQAVEPLARAAAAEPGNQRIRDNLELARAAVDERLPERRAGEDNASFAARLNDAGVVALRQGNRTKAAAAFARALEASDRWFVRAANNLAATEGGAGL